MWQISVIPKQYYLSLPLISATIRCVDRYFLWRFISPLNLLLAAWGTVAAPKAESADEPGSRFGTLEITSRKGGKLQRPVKPEKQGADVSRKTGSHDGPERGWPREPRGSLPGSAVLSVIGDARGLKGYLSRLLDERQWFNLRLLLLCGDGDTK